MIPTTILSGFLGSGKTSVLRYMLHNLEQKRIAVIVNEFGRISLDHHFIAHQDEDMIQLANGCVCCSIRSDLQEAIHKLADRGPWDALMIEASGVADPGPLLQTFLTGDMESLVMVDGLLTMVHGELLQEHLAASPVTERQIRAADLLLLSHHDTASEQQWQGSKATLKQLNPQAAVLVSDHGRIPLTAALSPSINKEARSHWQHAPVTPHEWQSVSLTTDEPLVLDALEHWLNSLPDQGVIRAKGIVRIGSKLQHWDVHLVGRRVVMEPSSNERLQTSQLVVIGRGLRQEALESGLQACAGPSRKPWRLPWVKN